MQYLLLTLGHNSSASVVLPDGTVIGYEQERFDRIKSSSAFPVDCLAKLQSSGVLNRDEETEVYVTHWFDQIGTENLENSKYFDYDQLTLFIRNYSVITVNERCTHHDAHAYSAVKFAECHNYFSQVEGQTHVLVADGFGNGQEVISLYSLNEFRQPRIEGKIYGYQSSLGLMYQYATSFCGMKENRDEYKFLGYESHLRDVLPKEAREEFRKLLSEQGMEFVVKLTKSKSPVDLPENLGGTSHFDLINFAYLNKVREEWHAMFTGWLNFLEAIEPTFHHGFCKDMDEFKTRVIVGYGVQYLIEIILSSLVRSHNVENLITCGGVFYNVKLNNKLLRTIDGLYCTNPINGDQGCGLGLFACYNPTHPLNMQGLIFGSLEDLDEYNAELVDPEFRGNILFGSESSDFVVEVVRGLINRNEVVNVKRRGQEFGPRALCHTSTLALPTASNAAVINRLNNRNEVMPMAPVMTGKTLASTYDAEQWSRVVGSDQYMIMTYHLSARSSREDVLADISGVVHQDPEDPEVRTSRPQVITQDTDEFMFKILKSTPREMLINTSFNYHGEPIILTDENALQTFNLQCRRAVAQGLKLPYLVLLNN